MEEDYIVLCKKAADCSSVQHRCFVGFAGEAPLGGESQKNGFASIQMSL
jgi:hypothetical protein